MDLLEEDKELFLKTNYLSNKAYKGVSLVDALKQIKVDSSFSNRKRLAKNNGISNYSDTYSQNLKLLNLLKQRKLIIDMETSKEIYPLLF